MSTQSSRQKKRQNHCKLGETNIRHKWRRDENTRRASRAYLMEFYAFFARVTLFRPVLDIVYILSFILDWNLPGYIRLVTLKFHFQNSSDRLKIQDLAAMSDLHRTLQFV